mmetsp:Transcript_25961/g.72470  ORF Transcript_25961/g.72470 Transcript_25961/m.72470 type:complete len:238 (+) Transcript_25961:642-1355(+)
MPFVATWRQVANHCNFPSAGHNLQHTLGSARYPVDGAVGSTDPTVPLIAALKWAADGCHFACFGDDFQDTLSIARNAIDAAIVSQHSAVIFPPSDQGPTNCRNFPCAGNDLKHCLCPAWDTINGAIKSFNTTQPLVFTLHFGPYQLHAPRFRHDPQHLSRLTRNAIDGTVVTQRPAQIFVLPHQAHAIADRMDFWVAIGLTALEQAQHVRQRHPTKATCTPRPAFAWVAISLNHFTF